MWRFSTKVTLVSLACVAAAVLIGVSIWLAAKPANRAPASEPPRPSRAPSAAHRALKTQALGGSKQAAGELIRVYGECSGHGRTDEIREACSNEEAFWFQIGLENGSPLAAQIKVNYLLQSNSCADIRRAEYWYRKYRQDGFGGEGYWRDHALEIREKERTCSW